jgi:fructokinase
MDKQVLCFGEVLWDTFADGKQAGGAPFNVARQLMKLGVNTFMVTRIGSDPAGDELMTILSECNMPLQLVQQDRNLPTCEVNVSLDDSQQATYTIPEPVSWDNIEPDDDLTGQAQQAAAIVFGSLANRGEVTRNTLMELLEDARIPLRVFDVNLREPHYTLDIIETLTAKANVVKMNEEEANLLIHGGSGSLRDKIVEFQHKFQSQTICVTRGENGAIIYHDEEFYEHPGFQVDVVDTVGAGDAFLATLIAGLLQESPMQQVLENACKIGAQVAGQRGAAPCALIY